MKLKNFGSVPAPSSVPELIEVAQRIALADGKVIGWRGQAHEAWKVEPGAARRIHRPWNGVQPKWSRNVQQMLDNLGVARVPMGDSPRSRQGAIEEYLRQLVREVRSSSSLSQPLVRASDLEVLTLLQHYGTATHLLDISSNILVALWIAATNESDKTGIIIAFSREAVTELLPSDVSPTLWEHFAQIRSGRPAYWTPPTTTPRMTSQQGAFVISQIADQPWGTVDVTSTFVWNDHPGWNERPGSDPSFDYTDVHSYFIAVTPELKKDFLTSTRTGVFGLNHATVYPDLPGFAESHRHSSEVPYVPPFD
ncbi:FRG domain-containing protein [Rhodococcus sp. ABRD24]|uniref:FRG domain-containing protein n=1 Tax=Rhodococcus sp. ABRD24 TaxID=2507582 RepID=UPI0013F16232|nr:FRG domain-containing protein [Rhodococcus sp. ABRD24]